MIHDWEQEALFLVDPLDTKRGKNSVVTNPYLPATDEVIHRFWKQVVKGDNEHCWIWIGAISTPDGYGRISWQINGQRRTLSAHRFALMLSDNGEIDPGKVADHACCEPLCVRTGNGHLRMVTQSENISYAVSLGRHQNNQPVVNSSRRAQRSLRVRNAVKNGWDYAALCSAQSDNEADNDQLKIW